MWVKGLDGCGTGGCSCGERIGWVDIAVVKGQDGCGMGGCSCVKGLDGCEMGGDEDLADCENWSHCSSP